MDNVKKVQVLVRKIVYTLKSALNQEFKATLWTPGEIIDKRIAHGDRPWVYPFLS